MRGGSYEGGMGGSACDLEFGESGCVGGRNGDWVISEGVVVVRFSSRSTE